MAISAAFIGSLAALIVLPRTGLSDVEGGLMTGFHVAGIFAGLVGAVAVIGLLRSLTSDGVRLRLHTYAGILATAWIFYEGMGVLLLHGPVWLVWLERISDGVVHRWFSPFAADWAMARLRVPWLSGGTLVLAVVALFRLQSLRPKAWVGGGLLTASLVLLPWGATSLAVPFRSPQAPSPAQAGRILEPMLSRIYHALSVENESQAYDRLAADITGDLVADLYLDSRRGLVSGIRQGASVTVKEVQVIEVGDPQPADAQSPGPVYACEWSVTAKVTHWQHTHERRNLYEGDVCLVVENDRWKLAELGLRSEEREVVPGSFQSR